MSKMRKDAEQEYTITAFDYVSNPVGSRDWELYWKGYQAAIAAVKEGGAVAWMLHDGEIWSTPVCPYKDEHGVGLFKLPDDTP